MPSTKVSVAVVDRVLELLEGGATPEHAWRETLAIAAPALPADLARRLATADLDADIAASADRLAGAVPAIPPEVDGLLVLLGREGLDDPGRERATAEVTGVAGYPGDEAWIFRHRWDGFHLPAAGLGSLLLGVDHRTDPGAHRVVDYGLVFAWCAALVVGAVERVGAPALLDTRPHLGVASGFHDGDIALVAHLGADGVERRTGWV